MEVKEDGFDGPGIAVFGEGGDGIEGVGGGRFIGIVGCFGGRAVGCGLRYD